MAEVAAPVAEAVPAAATEASARALTGEGAAKECGGRCFGDVDHWSCFQPLDELVDGDVEVPVPTDGPRKRSQDIQSLYSEGSRGWYHLQSLSRCVYLLCMELSCFAGLYQLSYILECCRPIKTMPEGLTDQHAG